MAATTTTAYSLSFMLNMVRGGDTNKRTLTFDYTGDINESDLEQVAQDWLKDYSRLIQPTNWRDTDTSEEEWRTIGITPSSKKTETITYEAVQSSD